MREIWKDIPGHEGAYQVSNLGRVRSLPRAITQFGRWGTEFTRTVGGKILRPGRCTSGHFSVVLGKAHGSAYVHALVMLAFAGPPPEGKEVRHKDGNPANNVRRNLQYASRSINIRDVFKHGGRRLTVEQVLEIRKRYAEGESPKKLAIEFGYSVAGMHSVAKGEFLKVS